MLNTETGMRTIVRVSCGLVAASLGAALVKVLHVVTPYQLWLGYAEVGERLTEVGRLVIVTAAHQAFFLTPLAITAILGLKVNRIHGWLAYVGVGALIGLAGLCVQIAGESGSERTVANLYAVRVYCLEGAFAGLVYWWIAGRFAAGRRVSLLEKAHPYRIDRPRLRVSDLS